MKMGSEALCDLVSNITFCVPFLDQEVRLAVFLERLRLHIHNLLLRSLFCLGLTM